MSYRPFNSLQCIELTFYVEGIEVCAGRLLGLFQDVDEEQHLATCRAKSPSEMEMQDAVIVAAAGGSVAGETTLMPGLTSCFACQNCAIQHYAVSASETAVLEAT